jgi:hypothetical protein
MKLTTIVNGQEVVLEFGQASQLPEILCGLDTAEREACVRDKAIREATQPDDTFHKTVAALAESGFWLFIPKTSSH